MDWILRQDHYHYQTGRNLLLAQLGTAGPIVVLLIAGIKWSPLLLIPILLAPAAYAVFMLYEFGWPTQWWAMFVGTQVKARADHILSVDNFTGRTIWRPEVHTWLKASIRRWRYRPLTHGTIQFMRKSDAALFKLAWG